MNDAQFATILMAVVGLAGTSLSIVVILYAILGVLTGIRGALLRREGGE